MLPNRQKKRDPFTMTALLIVAAVLQVAGLFVMLLAVRRAPIGVETHDGLQVRAEPMTARVDLSAVWAKTA